MKTFFSSVLKTGLLFAGVILGADAYAAATGPCAEDISKFCPDVKPGGGAIIECLEKHESKLTDACRAHEVKMHGRRGEMKERVQEQSMFRQACGDDMSKFCGDTKPSNGRIVKCLTAHEKELSAPCVDRLKTMEAGKE